MAKAAEVRARAPERPQAPMRLLLPAAVLAPLAILVLGAWIAWNGTQDQARAEMAHSADAAAEYARSVLDLHRMRAERVNDQLRGLTDAQIRANEPALHHLLQQTAGIGSLSPLFRIYAFDREGHVLLNTDFLPSPRATAADRDYFRALAQPDSPEVTVGETLLGRANGLLFFTVTLRRSGTGNGLPPGAFDGVINISVAPAALAEGLARLRGSPEDVLGLVRADGAVLARTLPLPAPPPWRQPSEGEVRRRMEAGEDRFERVGISPLDGVSRLVAYRRVDGWPVYIAAARDSSVIRAQWLQRVALLLGFGMPAVIGLGLLARLAQRTAETARQALQARVQERTAALAGSEGRLRLALEAANLGTWEADFRTGLVARSARTAEIMGYPPEPMSTPIPAWREALHPEDRPRAVACFEALQRGETDRYSVEYRVRRPDGSLAWVESCVRTVERDAEGRPLLVAGTLQDLTARREAEERRALLAREVDHRAKNALAVVQAALRLTPRTDPEHYAAAVEGRVAALARAHTLLAEQRWAGAQLRQLLEGELSAFLAGGRPDRQPRAELDGPELRVAAAAAQSLSLTFHELATNAVKYGALSVPDGRLRVAWNADPASGLLHLRWQETAGPPLGQAPTRRGFGARLVSATVRDQLGGRLEQRWLPDGLEVEISVPLDRVCSGPLAEAEFAD
ncbi:PAS domain-containing protein [Falsiroseomonas sp.]|uniref:PAS domain-containing protein n=1 Tax=Falsiroseomonas sp. TaxID=2870721 RepID=UPI003569F7EF